MQANKKQFWEELMGDLLDKMNARVPEGPKEVWKRQGPKKGGKRQRLLSVRRNWWTGLFSVTAGWGRKSTIEGVVWVITCAHGYQTAPLAPASSYSLSSLCTIVPWRSRSLWTIREMAGPRQMQWLLAHGMDKCTLCIHLLQSSQGPHVQNAPKRPKGEGISRK